MKLIKRYLFITTLLLLQTSLAYAAAPQVAGIYANCCDTVTIQQTGSAFQFELIETYDSGGAATPFVDPITEVFSVTGTVADDGSVIATDSLVEKDALGRKLRERHGTVTGSFQLVGGVMTLTYSGNATITYYDIDGNVTSSFTAFGSNSFTRIEILAPTPIVAPILFLLLL